MTAKILMWLMLGVLVAPLSAQAEDRPNGRMQTCTKAWLERRDAGQTEPYKPYLKACLAGQTPSTPTAMAHKTSRQTGKRPNRMKLCGAKWQDMKARGATGGQSWRDFSRQCLKT